MTVAVFFVLSAVATALLTGLALRVAQRKGWVDTPVDRSMHTYATPTGGGVAIVCVVTAALALSLDSFPIVVAALAVAIMGFIDDLRPLPVVPRLIVQGAAIAVGLHSLDALPTLAGFGLTFEPNWIALLILGVACLWHLNLFNFMDGIDGIASAETTFIGVVAAWLVAERGELSALWAVIGGAGVGFWLWNRAPARIFMGDAGSGFLGFVIAIVLVHSVAQGALSMSGAVILVSPFLCDATVTLLRRMARGEAWYRPHLMHAYQRLALRWQSHTRVVVALTALNLAIVLPAALAAEATPDAGPYIAGAVLGLISALVAWAGAGRAADPSAPGNP